jgi:tetratricopeptide (TPR) repeat protein
VAQIALQDYLRKIDELLEENRLAEVVAHCRHILQRYPRHVETYRTLGKALLEQQKHVEATDIFQRVLSADPEDFIAHAGLAVIHKDTGQIPVAIWHMERAFEVDPYNSAIQRELRDLYARRDGLEPERIALTRAALARLYVRGELFQQAAAELRHVLAAETDRIDLQILLAETLWRDEQRVEAVEISRDILEKLPYSIKANAILAEVWLVTGRVEEAQAHLRQLRALTVPDTTNLDPESIVGRAFSAASFMDLPRLVRLEELDYIPAIQATEAKADWVQEVGFAMAEAEAESNADTDWLRAMDTAGVVLGDESLAEEGPEDVLEWLREVTVDDEDAELDLAIDEVPDPFAELAAAEEMIADTAEDVQPAELASDDWLSDIDGSAEAEFWQAGAETELAEVDESEPETADATDLDDSMDDAGDQPLMPSGDEEDDLAIGQISPDEAFPDWLSNLSSPGETADAAGALPDWLDEPEADSDVDEDIFPDWLNGAESAGEPAAAMDELPDWLAESMAVETDEFEGPAEDQPEEADWLVGAAGVAALAAGAILAGEENGDADQPADEGEPPTETTEPVEVVAEGDGLPDWLADFAEAGEAQAEAGDLPDWLAEPEDADRLAGAENLPDWLVGSLEDETAETAGALAEEQVEAPEEQLDWLAGAALATGPAEDEEQPAVGEDAWEAEPAGLVEGAAEIGDNELPDWLISSQREQEELVMGTPEEPERNDQDVPEVPEEDLDETMRWLEELAAAQGADPDELPSFEDEAAEQPDEPVSEDVSFAEEDIPDWLQTELDETLISDQQMPDWAREGEEAGQQPEELGANAVTPSMDAGETAPTDDIPDWLRAQMPDDLDLSAPTAGGPDEVDDFADSLGWLDQIAAGEGEAIDEPPTLSWDSLEDDALEAAGLDDVDLDDMSWLEELAVHEDELIEDMPTPADDFLIESEAFAEEASFEEVDLEAKAEPLELAEPFDEIEMPEPADEGELVEAMAEESFESTAGEPDLDEIPEDPDEAMAWLEKLAAQQGAPLEELPSLGEVKDIITEPLAEAEPQSVEAFEEAALAAEIPEDPDEAMAWLEQLAAAQGVPAEELPSLSQAGLTPPVEAEEVEPAAELWEAEEPAAEEPDAEEWEVEEPAAEGWAAEGLADEEPVAEEWAAEKMAAEEPEPFDELVFETESAEDLAAVADTIVVGQSFEAEPEPDLELEQALAELADIEMPADDDEALAWLAALAGVQTAEPHPEIIEEMPTPPTAHTVPDWSEEMAKEVVADAVDEAVEPVVEDEIVEDEDEAMAWLEQLAARQGAALDELTSVEQVADEVATPDWVTREAEEAPPEAFVEPELEAEFGLELEEEWAAEELEFELSEAEEEVIDVAAEEMAEEVVEAAAEAVEDAAETAPEFEAEAFEFEAEVAEELPGLAEELPDVAEEPPTAAEESYLDIDQELAGPEMEGSLPDWLSLEPTGEAAADELDWLDTFGEADFESWLEAEEQSMAGESAPDMTAEPVAPAGEGWPAEAAVPELAEGQEQLPAEWEETEAEPESEGLVLPPISGPIDREKLMEARSALEAGEIDQAIDRYAGLIDEDQGLPMVIADLETAAGHLGAEPRLQRLLGDAYMRNGQLQKALEMYRQALDHL